MKILGPCTLVQAALPSIIEDTPQSFFDDTMAVFEVKKGRDGLTLSWFTKAVAVCKCTNFPMQENAHLVYDGLKDVPGLHPIMPSGTMYMMVSFCTR